MPLYQYQALKEKGESIKGLLEADSLHSALEKLKKEHLFPTKIKEIEEKLLRQKLSTDFLLLFTQSLSQLLTAKLPLYEAMLLLEERYRKHKKHSFFLDICQQLKRGKNLSFILSSYQFSLQEIYISLVKSAEQSSNLAEVFHSLTKLLTEQQNIKKKILSALTYPLVLSFFCIIVTLALLLFVVPNIEPILKERPVEGITAFVINASHFLKNYGLFLGFFLSCLAGAMVCLYKKGKLASLFVHLKNSLPFWKTLSYQTSLVRLSQSCAFLLKEKISLIETLRLSHGVVSRGELKDFLMHAEKKILEGKLLSHEMAASSHIPSLVVRMVGIGEESGDMEKSFLFIAQFYEKELASSLDKITMLLQPLLLVVLALIIGVVILSILLPMTDIGGFL